MATRSPHQLGSVPDGGHVVQMYGGDRAPLVRNVGRYLGEALEAGQAAVVIATPEHCAAFVAELDRTGAAPAAAVRAGRLLILDAAETLDRFLIDGQPDWERFEHSVGALVQSLRDSFPNGFRAYGEMVGVLWEAGRFAAAIRLEAFWNALLAGTGIPLFCGYPIDVRGEEFTAHDVDALLHAHAHLVPSTCDFEPALERAIRDVLGAGAASARDLGAAEHDPAWATLPAVEATILWLRRHVPAHASEILERARAYAQVAA